ncbi:MAG: hypothetical protein EZS28_026710, partial [Streblomastix strix]
MTICFIQLKKIVKYGPDLYYRSQLSALTFDVCHIYAEYYSDEMEQMNVDTMFKFMTFNKIILVFALAALSFGRLYQGNRIIARASTGNIYYDAEFQNKKGKLTVDMKGWDDSTYVPHFKSIDNYTAIAEGAKETDANFQSVEDATFATLKTSVALTADELKCAVVKDAHDEGLYSLLGYSAYYQGKADIAPSITHLIKAGVSEYTIKNPIKQFTDDPTFKETTTVTQTCAGGSTYLITYSTNFNGLVDTSCIPNTVVPEDASKCASGDLSPVLKGYKLGEIFGLDTTTLKKLIQRFGAVLITTEEDGEDAYINVIGWKKEGEVEFWIYTYTING